MTDTITIASWNINGIKARLASLEAWLSEASPDVACLQEIKSIDENFPREVFEAMGYNVETFGQKSFNGVAILSKYPLEDVARGLPLLDANDTPDEQARFIEATISHKNGALRVGNLYLPNGNPVDTEKFPYKLNWMDRLTAHAKELLASETPFVLCGDYNIIPQAEDCFDENVWRGDAAFRPESRGRYFELLNLGLTEALRATTDAAPIYTFWDYQAGAWQKNNGIRIDHHLLSPELADKLVSVDIHKHVRAWEKPSDHVPIVIELTI